MKKQEQKITPNIDENCPRPYLYKFLSFKKYTERIIAHGEIYFARPSELNNPFDSKPASDLKCEKQRPSFRFVNESKAELANKLRTKAEQWSYEKEWRLINHEDGPGVYEYPHESLTGVIMGCRIKERDRADLIKWCLERESKPRLYEARANDKKFRLDIVEVIYPN